MTKLARFFDITRWEWRPSGKGNLGIHSPLVSRKQPNAQTTQETFHESSPAFLWQRLKTPRLRTPPEVVHRYAQTRA
jgi:hypothetical protein